MTIDTQHTNQHKAGTRAECTRCHKVLIIAARDMCVTCYRDRNGRDARVAECVGCGRVMTISARGRCVTCYRHDTHPDTRPRYGHGPQPREFNGFRDMFARVEPSATLRRHERAALADVHRTWTNRVRM